MERVNARTRGPIVKRGLPCRLIIRSLWGAYAISFDACMLRSRSFCASLRILRGRADARNPFRKDSLHKRLPTIPSSVHKRSQQWSRGLTPVSNEILFPLWLLSISLRIPLALVFNHINTGEFRIFNTSWFSRCQPLDILAWMEVFQMTQYTPGWRTVTFGRIAGGLDWHGPPIRFFLAIDRWRPSAGWVGQSCSSANSYDLCLSHVNSTIFYSILFYVIVVFYMRKPFSSCFFLDVLRIRTRT